MDEKHISIIAGELNVNPVQVTATINLIDDGSTVPFISRYRKEMTGSLDEVAITFIRDRINQLRELDKRRTSILDSIDKQGKLTEDLEKKIKAAETLAILEDLYLPYKPKRRTRATIAREKGLEPLADFIMDQGHGDPEVKAAEFIDKEKGVETIDDALAGARDIIAERINENEHAREAIRNLYTAQGMFTCKVIPGMEEEGSKYKDYFEWSEPIAKAPSHRILAMRRGAAEKYLILRITVDEESAVDRIERIFLQNPCPSTIHLKLAARDSFKRLLSLSMETEMRLETKKRADGYAIGVFSSNLRELLMSSPLGQKKVLALDPGFRTGCKLVCLDSQGKLLFDDVAYLHTSTHRAQGEIEKIRYLCEKYDIEAIAIGNGTAGRETESMLKGAGLSKNISIVMVNESGASVYSASETAREEFPGHDVTVRGAVSIGRRLMDPLAELVKIDPKSIGVGQYQHDVDQNLLKQSLDDTVISCVNQVGVEVNTASKQLLTYVSGLGGNLATSIVAYRNENGPFKSRDELKKVKGMGAKTYEQAAGFLRIRNAENPLDTSAVHPESYPIVNKMCRDLNCTVKDLMINSELRDKIKLEKYTTENIGLPTLTDIKSELSKPGRDPREGFDLFEFAEGINKISDVQPGMKIPGIVTNVTAFGAFVDIGVHQDGLVHISELSDQFVKDPADVVKVQQKVKVTVLDVDIDRKRISLSMKTQGAKNNNQASEKPKNTKKQGSKPKRPAKDANKSRDNGKFGESLGLQLKF